MTQDKILLSIKQAELPIQDLGPFCQRQKINWLDIGFC